MLTSRRAAVLLAALAAFLLLLLSGRRGLRASSRRQFNASLLPAYVINGADALVQRKWVESELARVGYTSYNRINAVQFSGAEDDCVRTWIRAGKSGTPSECRQGLTHAHAQCWARIGADTQHDAGLVLEDDVAFHASFTTLFPLYAAALPADWRFVYIGQKRRAANEPSALLEGATMPWTTHAYMLTRSTAAFLASHYQFLLARSGSPHSTLPWYEPGVPDATPWQLSNWELNCDWFLLTIHRHYYSGPHGNGSGVALTWFAFESTHRHPAALGAASWVHNEDVEVLYAAQDACEGLWGYGTVCTSRCARELGRKQGRLPLLGTGLAFQNRCSGVGLPFALDWWMGEEAEQLPQPPSCAELRARIRPSAASEHATVACADAADPPMSLTL